MSVAYPSTPEQLLDSIHERDVEALGELYSRLAPGLLGMVLRILGERSAAEAVVDEVFLQLWSEARRPESTPGSIAARLVMMARTAAVRRLRLQRRLTTAPPGGPDHLRGSLSWLPQPEEVARLDQCGELLKKLVKQLPPAQRRTLDLAVFEGYTETEIAEKLGEPLGRVKSELRAGMRFLRHRLRAILGTWSANI
jgi:RNA polymerase sigma-70 factor, ECF subfamily